MRSKITCTVDGCENKFLAKGHCRKYYEQMRKHGRLLDRTIYNRNKLDNRKKANLRVLTKGDKLINKGLQNNNTSRMRGVGVRTLKSGVTKYEARISYKGKEIYLGRFKTLEKAKEVRKQKEKEIFGGDLIYEK